MNYMGRSVDIEADSLLSITSTISPICTALNVLRVKVAQSWLSRHRTLFSSLHFVALFFVSLAPAGPPTYETVETLLNLPVLQGGDTCAMLLDGESLGIALLRSAACAHPPSARSFWPQPR